MGFFTKKAKESNPDEVTETEEKIATIKKEYRQKQEELVDIRQKVEMVKEEYDATVSNLMSIKKELNSKKMELDVSQREYKKINEKIKRSAEITDSDSIVSFHKTEENLARIKKELEEISKEHDLAKSERNKEQTELHNIRAQKIEYQKELEEATARLYNAKKELEKKDNFEDASILTSKEKKFIEGNNSEQKSSAGVIEAASVVVGSLKSKLNMTQKELQAIQLLLEEERNAHQKTKEELEKIKKS